MEERDIVIIGGGPAGYVAAIRASQLGGKITLVETPNVKTIADLSKYLKIRTDHLIKTLVYKTSDGKFILTLIRGDLELHETKLKNYLGVPEIEKAPEEESKKKLGIPMGFAGPVGIKNIQIIADYSIRDIKGGVTGANRKDYHYKNVSSERDFDIEEYTDIRVVNEGDLCRECGKKLTMFRGIELGHIFKLGNKYSKAFGVEYLAEDGSSQVPLMGCYGIGVERTVAAVIEQNHDKDGIIWPSSIAPFHVHLLPVKYEGEVKEFSMKLYEQLNASGIEVLLDDRDERPGVKFKDADLIGIPIRITIGEKNLKQGTVEIKERRNKETRSIDIKDITTLLRKMVSEDLQKYR